MMKLWRLRSPWRFRSLIGSTSYESFANPKITAEKLIRKQGPVRPEVEIMHTSGDSEQIDLLEGKLQQAVNKNAKLKVKQTENSKLGQTALQQLANNTEQVEEGKRFFEEMLGKNSNGLDEINCLLNDLSTELDHEEQKIVSDDLDQASVKTYLGMAPQLSYVKKTNWSSFHKRSFHGTHPLDFGRKRKQSVDSKLPGNTARIILNPDDLVGSKYSYWRGIRKARSWCKSKSNPIDLSSHFGPGAEVYTTPENGTFHLTFEYKGREITFFISGRDLYIRGWEVDQVKIFEIRDKNDKSEKFIQDPRCIPIEMGVNYCDICKGPEFVRIGFKAMIDNFEVLHKSSSLSTEVMEAVAVFAVNGPEAIRFGWVLEDILEAFGSNLQLDSKRPLSFYVRKYAYYSSEYLTYVHHIRNGLPAPEIKNRYGGKIRDIYELRSLLSIPLRTALKKTSKQAKKEEYKSPVWSPPYPDGKDWLLKEEEQDQVEEQLLKEEEEEQMEEQLIKEEEQEQMEEQEETKLEDQQKMQDHNIGGSITRFMPFVNAGAPGVQINILPSGYPTWPRVEKFLRWFIR